MRSNQRADTDELLLYVAAATAIGASLLAAGWASGSPRVGALAAALAIVGVWVSWRSREWPTGRRVALGALGALLSAGALQALISWEIQREVGALYSAQGDVGLSLALRMSVLLVALSFLLVKRDALPFSLVPGVTLFGLAGGRGASAVAFGCFLVFLPAALAALAQAMLLSGIPARWRSLAPTGDAARDGGWQPPQSFSSWRTRHWSLLGTLVAVILGLGTLIYLPVYAYGTQYYWPLAMMSLPSGHFGFLEQRRTVDTYRSYSVGQGPIAPGQATVLSFRVVGPAPGQGSDALWRGEVFDSYTGNAWRSTDEEPSPLRIIRGEIGIERLFPPTAPATLVTHEVRLEKDMPLVLYGPGQIQRAAFPRRLSTLTQGQLLVDKFGCVTAPGATLRAGSHYQVTSDPAAYALPLLRSPLSAVSGRSLVSSPRPPAPDLEEVYLRIPLSSRRVADLARKLTANADTTQQKIDALIAYLARKCTYTLSAPAVPAGEDAADFFLFTSQRGYCDLFATAFAVMARSVGVPTRFVTGYAGGEYDPDLGRSVLRESDAHAWVEVYEPPYGWVAVDPTSGGSPVTLSPLAQAIAAVQIFFRSHPAALAIVAVLLLVALLLGLFLVLRRRVSQTQLALDRNDPRAIILRAYARLVGALARRGLPRRPSQTPLEYLQLVERESVERAARGRGRFAPHFTLHALPAVSGLTDLFLLARYSSHPIAPETAALAVSHLDQGIAALRRPNRHPQNP